MRKGHSFGGSDAALRRHRKRSRPTQAGGLPDRSVRPRVLQLRWHVWFRVHSAQRAASAGNRLVSVMQQAALLPRCNFRPQVSQLRCTRGSALAAWCAARAISGAAPSSLAVPKAGMRPQHDLKVYLMQVLAPEGPRMQHAAWCQSDSQVSVTQRVRCTRPTLQRFCPVATPMCLWRSSASTRRPAFAGGKTIGHDAKARLHWDAWCT